MRIGYSFSTNEFIGPDRISIGRNEVDCYGLQLTHHAADRLREILAIPAHPDLTADEVQVALAERELEQARADKVVAFAGWHHDSGGHCYKLTFCDIRLDDWETSWVPTRLAAAQAAVARVAELRAAQEAEEKRKRLPDVEEMGCVAVCDELRERGWRCSLWGTCVDVCLRWKPPSHIELADNLPFIGQELDEAPFEFHRRALRQARSIDGDA